MVERRAVREDAEPVGEVENCGSASLLGLRAGVLASGSGTTKGL